MIDNAIFPIFCIRSICIQQLTLFTNAFADAKLDLHQFSKISKSRTVTRAARIRVKQVTNEPAAVCACAVRARSRRVPYSSGQRTAVFASFCFVRSMQVLVSLAKAWGVCVHCFAIPPSQAQSRRLKFFNNNNNKRVSSSVACSDTVLWYVWSIRVIRTCEIFLGYSRFERR